MSWDLFAMKLPREARSVDELDDGYEPPPIGPRHAVIEAIASAVPTVDFSDPSWGFIETDQASIEVNLGREEIVDSFALHVRGGGVEVLTLITELLAAVDVRAIDGSSGDFFDADNSRQGWEDWQRYRDDVIGDGRSNEGTAE
jgi:hypothetical protein